MSASMTPVAKVAVTARYESASNAEESVIAVGKKLEPLFGMVAERLRQTAGEMGWHFVAVPGTPGKTDYASAWANVADPALAVKAAADMAELAIGLLVDYRPTVDMRQRSSDKGWEIAISVRGTVR
jgi:hypothetical protein